jgi:hypothetical protein
VNSSENVLLILIVCHKVLTVKTTRLTMLAGQRGLKKSNLTAAASMDFCWSEAAQLSLFSSPD